jgi:hypothetical protein
MSRVIQLKNCLKDLRHDSVKNFWLFKGNLDFLLSLLNMILQKKFFVITQSKGRREKETSCGII